MKSRQFHCPTVLTPAQAIDLIKKSLVAACGEQLVEILKIVRPWAEHVNYDPAADHICYSVLTKELMPWEEEVDLMTEAEIIKNFHRLLGKPLKPPVFDDALTLIDYMRKVLKENEIE